MMYNIIQDIAMVAMEDSYAIYQMVPFPMTLMNPNPVFKVRPFFDAEYL